MKRMLLTLTALILTLGGCSSDPTSPKPTPPNPTPAEETNASEVDYVNVGGKHYLYAWELALADTNGIAEIGEVEEGSVIPSGTPVYEIPGYPERDLVAVKTDIGSTGLVTNTSGYLVYVEHGEDTKYPEIDDQEVRLVRIYKGSELLRELYEEDVTSFLEQFHQPGPHNEFPFDSGPQYTVLFVGKGALGQNFGITEKDGQFGLAHIESKLPDGIARYFEELQPGVHVDWNRWNDPLVNADIREDLQTALNALAAKDEDRFRSAFISESAADAFAMMLENDYRFDEIGTVQEDGAGRIVVEVQGEAIYENRVQIESFHHLYYFKKDEEGRWRLAVID